MASRTRSASAASATSFAILMYHRIAAMSAPPTLPGHVAAGIVTSPQDFDADIHALSRHANVVSLSAALKLCERGQLPRRTVVLTFDDGFREHFGLVRESLCHFGMPATLFLTGHSFDTRLGLRWLEWFYMLEALASPTPGNQRLGLNFTLKRSLRSMDYASRRATLESMSAELGFSAAMQAAAQAELFADCQTVLQSYQAGWMTIGGHTLTHPCLAEVIATEQTREIAGSRHQLARIAPSTRPPFAYPFGAVESYDYQCANLVRDIGFSSACTSVPGYNTLETSRFELRRFDMCKHSLHDVLGGLT